MLTKVYIFGIRAKTGAQKFFLALLSVYIPYKHTLKSLTLGHLHTEGMP